ncbi:MAG: hypothetical protein WC807_21885 [Hyphomicrobium sp.]|jgi:hypothetical protein
MSTRNQLLNSVAGIIADYRSGEVAAPTSQHVERWINQFAQPIQEPMLAELNYALSRTYISKATVESFLLGLLKSSSVVGNDPCAFWRGAKFLSIQGGGHSQREMLDLFDQVLKKEYGLTTAQCGGTEPHTYLYLDDVLFTGSRIRNDLTTWINFSAPASANVLVVTMGIHSGGQYFARTKIEEAARAAGKRITLTWRYAVEIEDRRAHTDVSDVLRPTSVPDDPATQAYVQSLGYAPVLRRPGSVGGKGFFSSEAGRNLLEQEFLKTGAYIRSICPHLGVYQRPLGNMVLQTLGFGAMIVTFRNCPNNAPLALWTGDPWYPLFPRKTN